MILIMVRDSLESISIVTADESLEGGGTRLQGERLVASGEGRFHEGSELRFVEVAIRTQPAARIDPERRDLTYRFRDIPGIEPAGQKDGHTHRVATLSAHGPVVHPF